MSKKKVTRKKTTIKPTKSSIVKPTLDASELTEAVKKDPTTTDLLFEKVNYMYIIGGFGLMVIGFFLMSGGSMPDPNTWDDSLIYSARRTVIAPIFILAGLVVQVVAIFKKSS